MRIKARCIAIVLTVQLSAFRGPDLLSYATTVRRLTDKLYCCWSVLFNFAIPTRFRKSSQTRYCAQRALWKNKLFLRVIASHRAGRYFRLLNSRTYFCTKRFISLPEQYSPSVWIPAATILSFLRKRFVIAGRIFR